MEDNPLLKVENLRVWFQTRKSFLSTLFSKEQTYVRAVDGISFNIEKGEKFCLVGESGSGKTTTGKAILRLVKPTSGKVYFDGRSLFYLSKKEIKTMRQEMQMIFQDPYESLNPNMSAFDIIAEPLEVNNRVKTYAEKKRMVMEAITSVGLIPPEDFMHRYPYELSGGQRQRVAIASILILRPRFIVADEPVSMLDVSVRANILKLMLNLKKKFDLTFLYITHDLAVARYFCDKLAIMYLGKILEIGSADKVINGPKNPYTQALISIVPVPDPKARHREKITLKGEIPNPTNIPLGCRFYPRCPYAMDICREKEPELIQVADQHYVACHLIS